VKNIRFVPVVIIFIISIIITPSIINADPIEYNDNGHFYELIEENVSWSEARDRAQSMGGYLATITSSL
jgi:hypothetical protein